MSMPLWLDLDDEPDYDWQSGDTEEFYPVHDDPGLNLRIMDIADDDDFDGRDSDLGGV